MNHVTGFRLGDNVIFDDREWTITTIAGTAFGLRDASTGEFISTTLTELVLATGRPDVFDPSMSGLGPLHNADESTLLLARHVRELVDGTAPDGGQTRPEYHPSVPQGQRNARKLQELKDLGFPVGDSTLRRYITEYRRFGPAALLDRRSTRTYLPLDGVADEVITICDHLIRERVRSSSTTWTILAAETRKRFLAEWPDKQILLPRKKKLIQVLQELSRDLDPTGSAKNRQTAANSPNRLFSPRPGLLPGGEVQVDSSPFDVIVRMPDGKPGKVVLTIMMDKATRSIIATSVQRNNTGIDVASMLADALTPPLLRPTGVPAIDTWRLTQMEFPWAKNLGSDQSTRLDTSRPAMAISRLVTDNGRDYRSQVVEAACVQLGITLTRSAVRTPTDKAIVERAFHTIKTRFVMLLPGQTGGAVEARGAHPEREDLLDVEELIWLFDAWIGRVWQNTATEGLRDPRHPMAPPLSPNAMYAAMFPFVAYVPMPLSERDYIALLPLDYRTIQKDGVEFGRRTYDSPALAPYRLRSSRSPGQKKYEIRYRPTDPSRIWVYVDELDAHIPCDWRDRRIDTPHSRRMWDLAGQMRSKFQPLDADHSLTETMSLIQRAHRQWRQEVAKAERAEMAEYLNIVQGRTAHEGRGGSEVLDDNLAPGSPVAKVEGKDTNEWDLEDWEPDEALGIEKEV
ncbi:Mu transposase C-terminal domain-containing protein [Arthrobacter crystallopoietes]|uniref:Mu transposase C-terminal domain-containing protein n=1 Tax=Crystallibacter crystallopoietes TaxID=37928 RepID=UPI001110FE2E|nr:Mu transposase C-terminal domain-containing protein [Arthrobacter crystallopoietes]